MGCSGSPTTDIIADVIYRLEQWWSLPDGPQALQRKSFWMDWNGENADLYICSRVVTKSATKASCVHTERSVTGKFVSMQSLKLHFGFYHNGCNKAVLKAILISFSLIYWAKYCSSLANVGHTFQSWECCQNDSMPSCSSFHSVALPGVNFNKVYGLRACVCICARIWFGFRMELLRLVSGETQECIAKTDIMPLEGASPFSVGSLPARLCVMQSIITLPSPQIAPF